MLHECSQKYINIDLFGINKYVQTNKYLKKESKQDIAWTPFNIIVLGNNNVKVIAACWLDLYKSEDGMDLFRPQHF